MNVVAPGTLRDLRGGVDLEAEHPFFGSPAEARAFVAAAVLPHAGRLPRAPQLVDFGGGQGLLAAEALEALRGTGFAAEACVVDANPVFLEDAAARGLRTCQCDLAAYRGPLADVALMRLVLHYNGEAAQRRILANVRRHLAPHGWLALQLETGDRCACALRNRLAEVSGELAGTPAGHWVDAEAVFDWLQQAGFAAVVPVSMKSYDSDLATLLRNAWQRHSAHLLERGVGEEAFLQRLARELFARRRSGAVTPDVQQGTGRWSIRTSCPILVAFPSTPPPHPAR